MIEWIIDRAHVCRVTINDGSAERNVLGLGIKQFRDRLEHVRLAAVLIYIQPVEVDLCP